MGKSLQNWNCLWVLALASVQVAITETALAKTQPELNPKPNTVNAIDDIGELSHSPTPILPHSPTPPLPFAQTATTPIPVTSIQLETTETGLQVRLETADGELLAPTTTVSRNALIAEIPNTVLALPEEDEFLAFEPTEGIALVQVSALPGNRVQVVMTGTDAAPTAEVEATDTGLALSVVPGVAQAVEADDETIQIIVTGEESGADYFVPNASSTLRTDTPIRDTPSSVTVIPQQVIEDQGATNVRDIVRNAAGVNFFSSGGNRDEVFSLRGFLAETFRNGFRDSGSVSRTETELANIDRVEVLRGPASILFGRAEPSGIINFVTKQPLQEPSYEIAFTAGSFNFYRPTIDFTGPLTADGSLAYRLNAAYENADSFRDGVETERFFIAPTLSWQISDDTELTFEYSYLNDTRPIDDGLVILSDDEVADIPFSTVIGDPSIRAGFEENRAELYLDHRFSDNLSLRSRLHYTNSTERSVGVTSSVAGPSQDDRNFFIEEGRGTQSNETFTIQNDLIGEFNTGSIEHTVLFGLEYATEFLSFSDARRDAGVFDIFNPEAYVPTPLADEPFGVAVVGERSNDSFGIYLQNQIAIFENLQLVVGGRFDNFNEENLIAGETTSETEADAFSPRVGIVYRPVEPVSLYASYTRSFTPVGGRNVDNELFDPQRGTGFEVGVKTDIIPDRLFSTLAFYDTTLSNVPTADPDNPGFVIQTGEARSRGIELDIQGEILPGWNIFAGYAYTDAEVTESNQIPEGNRLPNVPEHNFNLWKTYTLQEGDLAGLGFGAGVFYVGERTGDLANSFFIDGYTRVDAAVYYERENYQFGLNFQNLFDSEFIEGAGNRQGVVPGAPFTVIGSFSVTF